MRAVGGRSWPVARKSAAARAGAGGGAGDLGRAEFLGEAGVLAGEAVAGASLFADGTETPGEAGLAHAVGTGALGEVASLVFLERGDALVAVRVLGRRSDSVAHGHVIASRAGDFEHGFRRRDFA